ncbi:clathrin heavy chain, putative, partial [Perkinsus marinus ATCC 50983]
MSPEFLTNYIGKNSKGVALELIEDMLRYNRQQNTQVVVQVAIKYHEQLEVNKLVAIFEKYQCWEGMFFFLGGILSSSQDPDVHFKYIEAAAKLGHMQEVERVVRESQYYDPVKVKDFLKEAKLQDPRPLIYVCDMHGYVEELTDYLYSNNLMKYIEVYVTKVNPLNCPTVVGTLIDRDCSEDYIKNSILGN